MMKFDNIVNNLKSLKYGESDIEFISSFLRSFEFPESTIKRIQLSFNSISKVIRLKNKILFISSEKPALHMEMELLKEKGTYAIQERFIVIFNSTKLLCYDTRSNDSINIPIKEIYNYIEFFLPLLGQEKVDVTKFKTADIKTAEKLASIFNELIMHPDFKANYSRKDLALLISRLLFCFWADSLDLLGTGGLIRILNNYTKEDGSNVNLVLGRIFKILKSGSEVNGQIEFQQLPRIGIKLFSESTGIPTFSKKARNQLLELCSIDWSSINADIIGSLIQTVVDHEDNSGLSNHYTSTSNILKVIGPLFLNELYKQFEEAKNDYSKLMVLLKRLEKIYVFDPSCGAGNFLIVSYKELKTLRDEIIGEITQRGSITKETCLDIYLGQFIGIDESYFKTTICRIGLCIESFKTIGRLDIKIEDIVKRFDETEITCSNPTRIDWGSICKYKKDNEIFLVTNPTYRGARKQSPKQKEDVQIVFTDYENISNLDYSSCWVYLSAKFIQKTNASCAIVTTNSITQGEQVGILWPKIYSHDIEISFAHSSFKWRNSSKGNTGVTVIILGLTKVGIRTEKILYGSDFLIRTNVISPYLTSGVNVIVQKESSPISDLPPMPKGNMPYDGGNLILSKKEKEDLLEEYPDSSRFIKRLLGSDEFIKGTERWCLWVMDNQLDLALEVPPIEERISRVYNLRINNADRAARKLAKRSHQFREINSTTSQSIIIPSVSSESREYIPIGFVDEAVIISNLAFAIYNCEPWIFGVITSKMHNLWIKTVCGALETRNRYSSRLGYNTFPIPKISNSQKSNITECVFEIIGEREQNSEKTMAQLYDLNKMPPGLLACHRTLDIVIEQCYKSEPFTSDQERIDYMFGLYNQKYDGKHS